jgi:hypothetical protein
VLNQGASLAAALRAALPRIMLLQLRATYQAICATMHLHLCPVPLQCTTHHQRLY